MELAALNERPHADTLERDAVADGQPLIPCLDLLDEAQMAVVERRPDGPAEPG